MDDAARQSAALVRLVRRLILAERAGREDEAAGLRRMIDDERTREALRPLLEALPERERMVLVLRFFESMTQTQIAERVGISQMHVSRLLAKSLARLRDQLE